MSVWPFAVGIIVGAGLAAAWIAYEVWREHRDR